MKSEKYSKISKTYIYKIFNRLKNEQKTASPPIIPIYSANILLGYMRIVSISSLESSDEIKRLAKWRKQSERWFPSQFKITLDGTRNWLKERLLDIDDRILFIIESPAGKPIGHIGLYRFNFEKESCQIDNVIRGEGGVPGIMTHSISALIKWTNKYLKPKSIFLETFSDNEKALSLYMRCGFKEIKRIPLQRKIVNKVVTWIEVPGIKSDRFAVYMKLK